MSVAICARACRASCRLPGRPRKAWSRPRAPPSRKRFFSRLNCRTLTPNALAPCAFVIRPASAALSNPARGTSFLLIEKVSRGDTSIEQIGRTVLFSSGKLAESHLTRRLFGQILRHIERLTWRPARRLTPSVGRPLDQVGGNPGGSVSEGGTQGWRLGGGAIPKRIPVIDSAWAERQVG